MDNPNQIFIDSGWKFVAAISGGGQEALGELTRYGGMSDTLLEGIIPYSPPAFFKLIGGKPDHIVSPSAARAAAMACYQRALAYAPNDKVFGFASTGAVVKVGGEREGRKHRVCMCLQMPDRTIGINLTYRPGRGREQEESLTAGCIREALKWGCHRFGDISKILSENDELVVQSHAENSDNNVPKLIHDRISSSENVPNPKVVFSSSFNPMHDGHISIIRDAVRRTGHPVVLELCVKNADKPALDYLTVKERLDSIHDVMELAWGGAFKAESRENVHGIVLTNKPLFFDKAALFPDATFVMGIDTFDRILNPDYYPCADSIHWGLRDLRAGGNRLLVYPRVGYVAKYIGYFPSSEYKDFTTFVDPSEFEPSALSSTELRKKADDV